MQNLLEIPGENGQPALLSYVFLNWLATAGQYEGNDEMADIIRKDIWPNPFQFYDGMVRSTHHDCFSLSISGC
jgi:hypothetical protein